MAKRNPSYHTWNVEPDQAVDDYHSLSSLFSVRCFCFRAFTPRQFPLKKLVYLQKTSANPNSQDVEQEPLSGEIVLVRHWPKNAIPSVNSQAGDLQNGDFSHCEERVSACENSAKDFTS